MYVIRRCVLHPCDRRLALGEGCDRGRAPQSSDFVGVSQPKALKHNEREGRHMHVSKKENYNDGESGLKAFGS
jgi:hypothetical protein